MRTAGKRAVESLIKAGALDGFGMRPALLASLDRILAASASHFRAAEAGQMSLFGAATGVQAETIILPENIKTDRKEMLNWERELIGLYLSDHPLSGHTELLTKAVSHNSLTLIEAAHEERVRVAGMVVAARPYKTKTDKMMGFVTIEDLQGTIELVVFPRTWDKTRNLCEQGKVIVIDGKVDSSSQPPKILVDEIRTEVTFYETAPTPLEKRRGKTAVPASRSALPAVVKGSVAVSRPVNTPQPGVPPDGQYVHSRQRFHPRSRRRAGRRAASSGIPTRLGTLQSSESPVWIWSSPASPEPVFFPAEPLDKAADGSPPVESVAGTPEVETKTSGSADIEPITSDPLPVLESSASGRPVFEPMDPLPVQPDRQPETSLALNAEVGLPDLEHPVLPLIIQPKVFATPEVDNAPPQLISILMRPSGNPERDRRRIKHIYGILISYPGSDRFSFRIFENGRGYLLDFPNETTRVCPDMLERLKRLIGEDSWRVEPLVYQ